MAQTLETDGSTITDEGVARLRQRIGIPILDPVGPFCRQPDEDALRHFAWAYGDDNPLWSDPDYASKTRWGSVIAPPGMLGGETTTGIPEVTALADEERAIMKGDPLRGAHAFRAGTTLEWWQPIYPSRAIYTRNTYVGFDDKLSEFAERSVHEHNGQGYIDDQGRLLGFKVRTMIRTDRKKAVSKGKYDAIQVAPYSREQLAEIDAQYASEKPRGAEPRYWEDVNEGDEIGPIVKGPLTVTDLICWHTGIGMGVYGVKPLRMGFKNRQRIGRFYIPNELNVPDVAQRCHWDVEYARSIGNPYPYDYGVMRENWLIHLCTDWMGDDGWLWKMSVQMRRFNYLGDTHWMRGSVARKYLAEGERPAVDLEIHGENQRGEITCPGHASVLLPSREHGEVRLPGPPAGAVDLKSLQDRMIERYSA